MEQKTQNIYKPQAKESSNFPSNDILLFNDLTKLFSVDLVFPSQLVQKQSVDIS